MRDITHDQFMTAHLRQNDVYAKLLLTEVLLGGDPCELEILLRYLGIAFDKQREQQNQPQQMAANDQDAVS